MRTEKKNFKEELKDCALRKIRKECGKYFKVKVVDKFPGSVTKMHSMQ